jgi:hypothetical protein
MAEILKATRAAVVTSGLRNRMHNFVPRAVAPRVAHVRVAEPIDIRRALADNLAAPTLTVTLRARLQDAQNSLSVELEPMIRDFRMRNPMAECVRHGCAAAV